MAAVAPGQGRRGSGTLALCTPASGLGSPPGSWGAQLAPGDRVCCGGGSHRWAFLSRGTEAGPCLRPSRLPRAVCFLTLPSAVCPSDPAAPVTVTQGSSTRCPGLCVSTRVCSGGGRGLAGAQACLGVSVWLAPAWGCVCLGTTSVGAAGTQGQGVGKTLVCRGLGGRGGLLWEGPPRTDVLGRGEAGGQAGVRLSGSRSGRAQGQVCDGLRASSGFLSPTHPDPLVKHPLGWPRAGRWAQAWDWPWSPRSASGGDTVKCSSWREACCGQEGSAALAEAGVTGGGQPGWAEAGEALGLRVEGGVSPEAGGEQGTSTLGHGCPSGDQNRHLTLRAVGSYGRFWGRVVLGAVSLPPSTRLPTKAGLSQQTGLLGMRSCLPQKGKLRPRGRQEPLAHPGPLPRGWRWLLAGKVGAAWVWLGQCGLSVASVWEQVGGAPWSQPGCAGCGGTEPPEGQIL